MAKTFRSGHITQSTLDSKNTYRDYSVKKLNLLTNSRKLLPELETSNFMLLISMMFNLHQMCAQHPTLQLSISDFVFSINFTSNFVT